MASFSSARKGSPFVKFSFLPTSYRIINNDREILFAVLLSREPETQYSGTLLLELHFMTSVFTECDNLHYALLLLFLLLLLLLLPLLLLLLSVYVFCRI